MSTYLKTLLDEGGFTKGRRVLPMLGGESPGRVGQSGRALQSESIYIPKGIPQIIAERPKLMAIVWPTGHARLTERKFRDLKKY